ncbi:hypothetical protein Val02_49530 [Virgisporangium aliadipatigenens]|uniref:SHOCT domain-containing protein n=1 Tax=Virgisporangium aliadipatigenens TaxID=741659 RepID=A0A8J3YPF7_9ACTN|nr:hypothetical protein [Virgisporangium aliadipatigenens]GIJ48067.1 hypothetical protein Val02_49530 [Virgisporangium aliadipatigenens]
MIGWLSLFAMVLLALWLCAYAAPTPGRQKAPPSTPAPQTPLYAVEERLARRLLAGQLSAARYRAEMAALARADAARKPFTVPPGR